MTAGLTWQQLRDVKLSGLDDVADGWGTVSSRAGAAHDQVQSEMTGALTKTQESESATAAVSRIQRLERNFQYTQTECGLVRTLLNGLASELAAPQRKLKDALADAESLKFTVESDGSVTYTHTPAVPFAPGKGTATPGAPVPLLPGTAEGGADINKGKAEDIAQRIADALGEAGATDARYASALRKLKAPPGIDVTDAMLTDAASDTAAVAKATSKFLDKNAIPHGKSAAENKKWWDGLTPEQQAEYSTVYPHEVGALDGIPSTVRDDANRMVLAETHAKVQRQLDSLGPEPPKMIANPYGSYPVAITNPAWQTWHDGGGDTLRTQLKGMDAIQSRFDKTGEDGLPDAYLLGFDLDGNGHAILANGNPDTAVNTAVYVPGTSSKLESFGGDVSRMTAMWREGHAQDPGESLSTITWLGYDAPQNIVTDSPQKHYAYDGAPRLNQFLDGLQSAQGGADASHTTVIGHSYGTTTIGAAAQKGDLAADDLVVVGSPGMLVGNADDLDVGKDHVWSEAGRTDPVPLLGKSVGLGGHEWGVSKWNGIPYDAGYIENVPSDEAFGAHRMDVDTSGHSDYWNSGTESLKNQAFVVVGQYSRVSED